MFSSASQHHGWIFCLLPVCDRNSVWWSMTDSDLHPLLGADEAGCYESWSLVTTIHVIVEGHWQCVRLSLLFALLLNILYVFQHCILLFFSLFADLLWIWNLSNLIQVILKSIQFNLDHNYGEAFYSFKDISLIRIDSSVLLLKMLSRLFGVAVPCGASSCRRAEVSHQVAASICLVSVFLRSMLAYFGNLSWRFGHNTSLKNPGAPSWTYLVLHSTFLFALH
jgi:hypothetical protein